MKDIQAFETAAQAAGTTIKYPAATLFGQPDHRGDKTRVALVPYQVEIESAEALATLLAVALASFKLESVYIVAGTESLSADRDAIEGLGTGLIDFANLS